MLPEGLFDNGYFDVDLLRDDITMYMTQHPDEHTGKELTDFSQDSTVTTQQTVTSHDYLDESAEATYYSPDRADSPSSEVSLLDVGFEEETWRTDPDWLPATVSTNESSYTPSVQQQPTSHRRSASKRSSTTTPIELDIILDETTKRTKRCTAPLSEQQKRVRRKELNRLAAQRCRTKRMGQAEVLELEIEELTKKNDLLQKNLEELSETKDQLYEIIKFHFQSCHGKTVEPLVIDLS